MGAADCGAGGGGGGGGGGRRTGRPQGGGTFASSPLTRRVSERSAASANARGDGTSARAVCGEPRLLASLGAGPSPGGGLRTDIIGRAGSSSPGVGACAEGPVYVRRVGRPPRRKSAYFPRRIGGGRATLASCDSSSSFHTAAHPTTHPTLPPFRPPPSQMTLLPPHSFTSSPLYARMLENLAESMRRTEESRLYFERHPDAFPPAVDEPSDDGGDAESPASSSSPSPSSSSSESNGAAPPSPPPAPSSSSAAMAGFFDGKRSTLTSGLEWSRRAVRSYAARMGGTAAGWR